MLPTNQIAQYGGKGAIINHIHEKLPKIYIPPYVIKQQEQWLWSIRKELRTLKYPLIGRSSSPYEYADFEGIFESIPWIKDENALRRAIDSVNRSAFSERAILYAKQNNFPVSKKIHTIIQEQHQAEYQGAMLRHPNNPDLIFIDCYKGMGRDHKTFVINTKTRTEQIIGKYESNSLPLSDACYLADVYEQIESLKDIAEGYSFYIEFGLHPFALYQVRPFKEIKTANFDIPHPNDALIYTDLAFGITPEEGLVYPILRTFGYKHAAVLIHDIRTALSKGKNSIGGINPSKLEGELIDYMFDIAISEQKINLDELVKTIKTNNQSLDEKLNNYCLLSTSVNHEIYDIDLTVPHMKAMVVNGLERFLTHDVMRLLKKADVSVEAGFMYKQDFFNNTKSGDKIRIISNGKEAVVMRE